MGWVELGRCASQASCKHDYQSPPCGEEHLQLSTKRKPKSATAVSIATASFGLPVHAPRALPCLRFPFVPLHRQVYGVHLPSPYAHLMRPFQLANFDVVGLYVPSECIGTASDRILVRVLLPILLLSLFLFVVVGWHLRRVAVDALDASMASRCWPWVDWLFNRSDGATGGLERPAPPLTIEPPAAEPPTEQQANCQCHRAQDGKVAIGTAQLVRLAFLRSLPTVLLVLFCMVPVEARTIFEVSSRIAHTLRTLCCLLLAACCLLPAACCVLRVACCVLRAACCLLLAACCLLPAACCLLLAA